MAVIVFEKEVDIDYVRSTLREFLTVREDIRKDWKQMSAKFDAEYRELFPFSKRFHIIKNSFWQWFFFHEVKDLAWQHYTSTNFMRDKLNELFVQQQCCINTYDLEKAVDLLACSEGKLELEQCDIDTFDRVEKFVINAKQLML